MAIIPYVKSAEMENLLSKAAGFVSPDPGTLIDGTVIVVQKNKVLVSLGGYATGVISGQEAYDSAGTMKTLEVGDEVSAYVLEPENEDGLVVLSLRKASQEKTWKRFVDAHESDGTIEVSASEANKGGLLLNIDGIKGFHTCFSIGAIALPTCEWSR
jgi:small subunit ribosomal protein S1